MTEERVECRSCRAILATRSAKIATGVPVREIVATQLRLRPAAHANGLPWYGPKRANRHPIRLPAVLTCQCGAETTLTSNSYVTYKARRHASLSTRAKYDTIFEDDMDHAYDDLPAEIDSA